MTWKLTRLSIACMCGSVFAGAGAANAELTLHLQAGTAQFDAAGRVSYHYEISIDPDPAADLGDRLTIAFLGYLECDSSKRVYTGPSVFTRTRAEVDVQRMRAWTTSVRGRRPLPPDEPLKISRAGGVFMSIPEAYTHLRPGEELKCTATFLASAVSIAKESRWSGEEIGPSRDGDRLTIELIGPEIKERVNPPAIKLPLTLRRPTETEADAFGKLGGRGGLACPPAGPGHPPLRR